MWMVSADQGISHEHFVGGRCSDNATSLGVDGLDAEAGCATTSLSLQPAELKGDQIRKSSVGPYTPKYSKPLRTYTRLLKRDVVSVT